MVFIMLNMYVGKNVVKVDESNLLDMDITVLKSIPYSVASKYAEYISAIEVCVEDCLDIPTDIKDETSYLEALVELESIIKEEESVMVDNNVVVEEVTVKTNSTSNKEEKVMMETVKENMSAAVEEMIGKFTEAKENIKVNAGETKEEYFNKVDDSLNIVKGSFGDVLGKIDSLLGFTELKDDILEIIESGCNENTSKKDLFKMARKCREIIEDTIEDIEMFGDPDKAATLKELINNAKGESIFKMFFSTMIWIGKKVARKLRTWFHVDDEKSVIGSICRSIGGFVSILRAGAKIVWNATKFAVSFVVAGVIKVADFIYRTIKTLVVKIKAFAVEKYEQLTNKDFVDDLEEDLDDDFFADDEE